MRRHRHRSQPGRTLVIVVALLTLLGCLSTISPAVSRRRYALHSFARGEAKLESRNIEAERCLLVHEAKDQCAFIKENCPDEEAGLLSYLTLYYCRLPHLKPLGFSIIALWTGLLFTTIGVAASDFFCVNLSTIASILGMSESIAGVTFLAFGNGSPDVFSTFAAMKSHSGSLAVGELIGAAGFITAVVSGAMAIIRPFKVAKKSFVRDIVFFIIAVCFSMVFLANGSLDLWECAVMVGFYVFYVLVVVLWQWWLNRRRHRRTMAAAARGHYVMPGPDQLEFEEEYRDEEEGEVNNRTPISRGVSTEDFRGLERADDNGNDTADDLDHEEARDKFMGTMSSNMRVARTVGRDRRSTTKPIRPSLAGALEFRAVLASLQKSRNLATEPINLRRYSDEPQYASLDASQSLPPNPNMAGRSYTDSDQLKTSRVEARPGMARPRAVSVNDAAGLCLDEDGFRHYAAHDTATLSSVPEIDAQHETLQWSAIEDATSAWHSLIQTPILSVTKPDNASDETPRYADTRPSLGNTQVLRATSANETSLGRQSDNGTFSNSRQEATSQAQDLFTRPNLHPPSEQHRPSSHPGTRKLSPAISPGQSPGTSPKDVATSGDSTPKTTTPFSLPPSAVFDPRYDVASNIRTEIKSSKWWPYSILPPPSIILHTLFPTLHRWRDKSILDKVFALAATPSFFLLAITLPVVDMEGDIDDGVDAAAVTPLLDGTHESRAANHPHSRRQSYANVGHHANTASVALHAEDGGHHQHHIISSTPSPASSKNDLVEIASPASSSASTKEPGWNRWLVITQCFTAPYFVIFLVWANLESSTLKSLLLPSLYSLLGSLVALLIILYTTTPDKPPNWHFLLCFVGFAVSITWISTIANEVVGVLKTIGVIFSMSDAILGLTIFACGNSLGDLVADITVAKLGHPVMALSACFGGPLLNILLGIGLGGLYMTLHDAGKRHHKHPNSPTKYKPYHIQVSTTLLISAAALLVTLVGLLIAVPLNGWRMDRKIGYGLIGLWCVSTVGNVIVEVTGLGGD